MAIKDFVPYNTLDYESFPMIRKEGFREYDARWLIEKEINYLGVQYLGAAIATHLESQGHKPPRVVVGHDYRSYSEAVKYALITGLLSAGAEVYDIGLAITPMAYFAQHYLKLPGIAMVTASHNENGWTGIKVGSDYSLTYGPDLMAELSDIVYSERYITSPGTYRFVPGIREAYIADITNGQSLLKKLTVVVNTGNGTASIFSPEILERIGCKVIPIYTELDWNFPNFNPNPENMAFLEAIKHAVKLHGADIGFGFDGDGDRIGVVDDLGGEIFSDKIGLLIARDLSSQYPNSHFVVDVKSTGLFSSDTILKSNNASTEYWITGHSYIKARVHETKALAGFEKSGHFFFSSPLGRGYDDANLSAIIIAELLAKTDKQLSQLREELPKTWQSPTMAPYCPDDCKYQVVDQIIKMYENEHKANERVCGHTIRFINTVNGVRVEYDDGSWGLVRASSNKPSLVIVIESMTEKRRLYEIFDDINYRLKSIGGVGEYDQMLPPFDETEEV